jgi:hypothetical protein
MVKEAAVKLISNMDENVSMGDIMYRLYVLDKHQKAMGDIKNGRVYTSQNVRSSIGVSNETAIMD